MLYADNNCTYEEQYEPHRYVYTGTCHKCKESHTVSIPGPALFNYRKGAHIQDAMPMVTPGDREFLMTGMCPDCFDALFADDEECNFNFVIMGKPIDGEEEVVDYATDKVDADYLLGEYQLAFGKDWKLWIADNEEVDDG